MTSFGDDRYSPSCFSPLLYHLLSGLCPLAFSLLLAMSNPLPPLGKAIEVTDVIPSDEVLDPAIPNLGIDPPYSY